MSGPIQFYRVHFNLDERIELVEAIGTRAVEDEIRAEMESGKFLWVHSKGAFFKCEVVATGYVITLQHYEESGARRMGEYCLNIFISERQIRLMHMKEHSLQSAADIAHEAPPINPPTTGFPPWVGKDS